MDAPEDAATIGRSDPGVKEDANLAVAVNEACLLDDASEAEALSVSTDNSDEDDDEDEVTTDAHRPGDANIDSSSETIGAYYVPLSHPSNPPKGVSSAKRGNADSNSTLDENIQNEITKYKIRISKLEEINRQQARVIETMKMVSSGLGSLCSTQQCTGCRRRFQ
mmetsp:Transcript_27587/g.44781  ORF Transcript_27587/g.44781 Transcript_27587/m.44781 type:complete len:165 (+) Transcript_27587:538-1032(+)